MHEHRGNVAVGSKHVNNYSKAKAEFVGIDLTQAKSREDSTNQHTFQGASEVARREPILPPTIPTAHGETTVDHETQTDAPAAKKHKGYPTAKEEVEQLPLGEAKALVVTLMRKTCRSNENRKHGKRFQTHKGSGEKETP